MLNPADLRNRLAQLDGQAQLDDLLQIRKSNPPKGSTQDIAIGLGGGAVHLYFDQMLVRDEEGEPALHIVLRATGKPLSAGARTSKLATLVRDLLHGLQPSGAGAP